MSSPLLLNAQDSQVLARGQSGQAVVTAQVESGQVCLVATDSAGSTHRAAGPGTASIELPTGGPYNLEASTMQHGSVLRRAAVDVHVGDVWVLAGQSNMQGCAPFTKPADHLDRVRVCRDAAGWERAQEPLHRLYRRRDAPLTRLLLHLDPAVAATWDEVHATDADQPVGGQGPAATFAAELVGATGVPVGLLPCALGGSSLALWDPGWSVAGLTSLFQNLVDSIRAWGPARGVLWYQGEADAIAGTTEYAERFARFVTAVRRAVGDPDLRFLTVQLAPYDPAALATLLGHEVGHVASSWQEVREAQRSAARLPGVDVVSAADLSLFDAAHLDTAGAARLGRRLARAALRHVPGTAQPPQLPDLAEVARLGARTVCCRFSGVQGVLTLVGGDQPFRVEAAGEVIAVTDVVLAEAEVVLHFAEDLPVGGTLTYAPLAVQGAGLVDERDLALPAFGPIPIPSRSSG